MAKRKRNRDFHEPWASEKSQLWRSIYKTPPFRKPANEDEEHENAKWEAAKLKAERDADVMILGSRMTEAAVSPGLLGTPAYFDDRRIMAFVRVLGLPEGAPTHEEMAQRCVDAVNAMTGISDPIGFMGELVAFLTDMAADPIDQWFHGRATRLLYRVAEQKELIAANISEEEDACG